MGEVRRVRDRLPDRHLARKRVHASLVHHPAALSRFLAEAQATSQLQHLAIVPVHDLGRLPDRRLWFTTREVRGRTLGEVIRDLHQASVSSWERPRSGWTLRRVVDAFHTVCQAVAFAHQRGVLHRDLKPDHPMLGDHGEVYVLDWGLAKRLDGAAALAEPAVDLDLADPHVTRIGEVAGTPAYLPPEQAAGEVERIDERTDVYAPGAILYEILSGRRPYEGSPASVLRQVLAGPPEPVGRSGLTLPEELVEACERAMARAQADRFPSAKALAEAIQDWLDGSRRREQALEVGARAEALAIASEERAGRAARLRAEAATLLEGVAGWEPEERKAPGWAREAEAEAEAEAAELGQLAVDQALNAALQAAPGLPEAHAALAERNLDRHRRAEAAREPLAKVETLLRAHAEALPPAHPGRTRVRSYLQGDGALTLESDRLRTPLHAPRLGVPGHAVTADPLLGVALSTY